MTAGCIFYRDMISLGLGILPLDSTLVDILDVPIALNGFPGKGNVCVNDQIDDHQTVAIGPSGGALLVPFLRSETLDFITPGSCS